MRHVQHEKNEEGLPPWNGHLQEKIYAGGVLNRFMVHNPQTYLHHFSKDETVHKHKGNFRRQFRTQ